MISASSNITDFTQQHFSKEAPDLEIETNMDQLVDEVNDTLMDQPNLSIDQPLTNRADL